MEKSKLYEKNNKITPLLFVTVIVNVGQENFYRNLFHDNDAAIVLSTHGYGTKGLISEIFTADQNEKRVIFAVIQKQKWTSIKRVISNRFAISNMAKGIAFETPLNSVAGVSTYKWLSNSKKLDKKIKTKRGK